jgi:hypothetical protein
LVVDLTFFDSIPPLFIKAMVARIDTLGDRVKIATTELVEVFPEFREIIIELCTQVLLRIESLLRSDICDDRRTESLCQLMAAFMQAHKHDMSEELFRSIVGIRLDLNIQLFQRAIIFDNPNELLFHNGEVVIIDSKHYRVRN